jgi:hypothetical protein
MVQANAAYNAVPQVNPWIASLAGASAGFSGAANAGAMASPTNSNNSAGGFGNFMSNGSPSLAANSNGGYYEGTGATYGLPNSSAPVYSASSPDAGMAGFDA